MFWKSEEMDFSQSWNQEAGQALELLSGHQWRRDVTHISVFQDLGGGWTTLPHSALRYPQTLKTSLPPLIRKAVFTALVPFPVSQRLL